MSDSEQPQRIAVISKGDIVRAVRQCIADSGINLDSMIREAIQATIEKRIETIDVDVAKKITERAVELVKIEMYSVKNAVAQEIVSNLRWVQK